MTTKVPATGGGGGGAVPVGVMKSEMPETSEEDDCEEEEDNGEEDVDSGSQQENEDGELFDYIYGSESNDNYVMGE